MNTEPKKMREFGRFRIDTEQKVLWHDRKVVSMPLKELEVLCLLVENHGKLVAKSEILDKIWADSFVEENNLSRHIYLLRKTLNQFGADKTLIENVPRRGYRFTGEVRDVSAGEIIVEKHTRTRTLIEFEKAVEEEKKARRGKEEKTFYSRFLLPSTAVLMVALLAGVFAFSPSRGGLFASSGAPVKSIAVLPFKTIDAGQENSREG